MASERSMPLPNTSPDMSPMPTTLMRLGLHVDAELGEVVASPPSMRRGR